jgi:predicted dehydrogenase
MAEKTYRVGIIGLGRMGSTIDDEGHTELPYSIAASAVGSPRLELVAGADLDGDKCAAFAQRWNVDAVYGDFREMVERASLDLVAVCTAACLPKPHSRSPGPERRDDSHADLTVALCEMGVPMLYVEKAMASSMVRADEVLAAVQKADTVFNTGVLRRFDNRYAVVRDAVLAGVVGDVKSVVHYAPSSLMHGHIHSIDTVSYLIGDPSIEAVRGELLPRDENFSGRHIAFDPHATYQLRFANGVEAWTVPGGYWEFEVLGSEGSIRSLNNGAGVLLRKPSGKRGWQEEPFETATPKSPVVQCLEDLVDAYESGQPSTGNVEVTHHITEACIGIAESHLRGGAWVELPLAERDLYVFHV